ncbi:MAG TPA: HAD family hydrolase [Vicinamibacterales bacterium]|nr:HAD family hydrolase [Vicinamibacterales bacterium]
MQRRLSGVSAIVFDVDGTLIDSNPAHAEAWAQALTEHGFPHEADQLRPLIGMGSDKLLPAVARLDVDSPRGKVILARKKTLFDERLPLLQPTRGARTLLTFLREQDKTLVVATSADDEEMHAILEQARVGDLIPRRTSSDDAGRSKPDPDIVQAALVRAGAPAALAVMIGDTPYDIEAARRAGVDCIALRCGGWWQDRDLAGAIAIADDPQDLLGKWRTPF